MRTSKPTRASATGAWLAAAAVGIILVVRSGYVAVLVSSQGRRARRLNRERLESFNSPDRRGRGHGAARRDPRRPTRGPASPERQERRIQLMRTRVTRALADLDYYQSSPLGWKHGTIIVWAGMRGVVTLAAAQTLPRETPGRALLVFVAFLVAVGNTHAAGLHPAVARPAAEDGGLGPIRSVGARSSDGSTTRCAWPRRTASRRARSRAGTARPSRPSCSRSSDRA